ncbi:MAG TPA: hypothetical protein VHI93_05740 [Candidatus Thermoplasmatota archaeon]|nr:hypothetical protein [Candidatus Thermoplasmatota archaeon]
MLPSAAASAGLEGELTTSAVHLGGSYLLEGDLLALLQEPNEAAECPGDPGFALQAGQLRLENDTADLSLHVNGKSPSVINLQPQTTRQEHGTATVEGIANRPDCRWDLLPLDGAAPPRVEVPGTCAAVKPSDRRDITRMALINPTRGSEKVSAESALRLEGCAGENRLVVRVTGSFRLSLWDWDAVLTEAGGRSFTITTGLRQSPVLPGNSPDASAVVAREQETFLFVRNGTLTTTVRGTHALLYVGSGGGITASNVKLQVTSGHLSVGDTRRHLAQNAVALEGELALRLHGTSTNNPFQARVSGRPAQVVVDGLSVPLATAAPGIHLAWLWLLGGVGLVALPVLARARVPSALRRRLLEERVDDLIGKRDPQAADPLTQRLLAWAPNDAWAHQRRAKVLAQRGRPADLYSALKHHEEVARLLRRQVLSDAVLRAENALEAARVSARLHALAATAEEREAARRSASHWVGEAKAAGHLRELEHHTELEPFLRTEEVPYWLLP